MYRIIFDADKALWVIELCKFTLYWKRVKGKEFDTLAKAEEYAVEVGLDTAYRRQPTMVGSISIGHVPPHPIPAPRNEGYQPAPHGYILQNPPKYA